MPFIPKRSLVPYMYKLHMCKLRLNKLLLALPIAIAVSFFPYLSTEHYATGLANTQEPLTTVAKLQSADPSGIVVLPNGRIFLGFPRHAVNHDGPTLAELKDGQLLPFPDSEINGKNGSVSERLISVHGMTTDNKGNIWVIDDGKIAGQALEDGAVKLIGFDPTTKKTVGKVLLHTPEVLTDSHMNDLRIDHTHGQLGTAYITDSSFGNSAALVVVDIASGKARRVFEHNPATQAESGFVAILEKQPHRFVPSHSDFPTGGADGITLSKDCKTLYWTSLSSRRLYSIATDILSDYSKTRELLSKNIADEGERPACDGIATDADNQIYFGAFEHDSIIRRRENGRFELVTTDKRLFWPDALFVQGDYLYVTLGQWNRLPGFNGGKDLRKPPFEIVKVRIRKSQ